MNTAIFFENPKIISIDAARAKFYIAAPFAVLETLAGIDLVGRMTRYRPEGRTASEARCQAGLNGTGSV